MTDKTTNIFNFCETSRIELKEFSDLHRMVELFEGPYWIFRGQPKAHMSLCPGIIDWIEKRNQSVGDDLEMFSQWCEKSAPLLDSRKISLLDAYVLAYRNGLPTRLLSWTKSLFVACFFAVSDLEALNSDRPVYTDDTVICEKDEKETQPSDGAVFAFKWSDRVSRSERLAGPACVNGLKIFDAQFLDNSYQAQQTVFTLQPLPFEEHHKKPDLLYRLVIPGELKRIMKQRLRAYNITPASLFPNLYGNAVSVIEEFNGR